ncbi:MAG TPA: type III-A CRISPR-associated protein Csm2 [Cyanobacteria bacterium UBA11372]|nr:type III-A CRISPR-associated protein Csm2 [Cyanobacteria bacterium UBA11372]
MPNPRPILTDKTDIVKQVVKTITDIKGTLKYYPIRDLVKEAEAFGKSIKDRGLKTNQIRKFLDTVNRLKVEIKVQIKNQTTDSGVIFLTDLPKIDSELVLLKQKLAYASARQDAVKPLKEVMDAAIEKVEDSDDFERFFQLIESIIAYHKAAGGE